MIIATSITENYLKKSEPFFDSVNKHFQGKKICFCIDFFAEIKGWETIYVPTERFFCKWQPKNRKEYYSLQHGEFVDFYNFKDEDIVCFIDSDMILQKDIQGSMIETVDFLVTNSSFPPTKIEKVVENLKCKLDKEKFLKKYDLLGQEEEFCATLLIAKVKKWKELNSIVKTTYKEFFTEFTHHAAWQLLINVIIIMNFKRLIMKPHICNATWYSGTQAEIKDKQLVIGEEIVCFNHTKFNGDWKY